MPLPLDRPQGAHEHNGTMPIRARLLVAASGAIVMSLGLWYGRGALAVGDANLAATLLIGGYSVALLIVGFRLVAGHAGRAMLALAVAMTALPVVLLAGFRFVEFGDFALSPALWLLAIAATVCSLLALVVTRRAQTTG